MRKGDSSLLRFDVGVIESGMSIRAVDWENWPAEMPATLVFVVQDGQVLLIEKQRGIGAGKINGPGGKIDPGETPYECAVREVQEELCITVKDAQKRGELFFDMSTMPNIHCHVYVATEFEGTPTATPEAIPRWTPLDKIPYDQMWDDDQYWLPRMLAGESFIGKFIFDDEEILWQEVEFSPQAAKCW